MVEPTIRFPVLCPKCATECLTEFAASAIADALLKGTNICLVATCHNMIWNATDIEREQIREYFEAISSDHQRL